MVDTSALPVVDVHCHPFLNKGQMDPEQFTNTVSFGGGSPGYMAAGGVAVDDNLIGELQRVKRDVLYFRFMLHQLAAFFDCQPDLEHIIDERNKAVEQDYTEYVRRLYADCGLTTLVTDFGYPQPPIAVSDFASEIPAEVVPIYRIEPLIVQLFDADIGWEEFRRGYDEAIASALEKEGYRGLKSIIEQIGSQKQQ
jgi:hypothetical protein